MATTPGAVVQLAGAVLVGEAAVVDGATTVGGAVLLGPDAGAGRAVVALVADTAAGPVVVASTGGGPVTVGAAEGVGSAVRCKGIAVVDGL